MTRRKRDHKPKPAIPRGGELPARPADAEPPADPWRPWLLSGMTALLVARPLFPSESAAQGDGLSAVMLWLTLVVFWFLGPIGRRRWPLRFGWVDAAVVCLVALHTLAALWAAWYGAARPAINMLWEWLAFGVSFLLARQLIVSAREARAVIVVMVALALALASHGLYQYFYELPATRAQYQQDPDRALREAGLWYEPGSRDRELFEKRLASIEPLATFALTNSLAGYLAPWLVIAIGIGLSMVQSPLFPEGEVRSRRLWTWLAVAFTTLPIAVCVLLTKSRSAYASVLLGSLLAGLLLTGGLRRGVLWALLITAVGAVLLAAVTAFGGLDRQVWSEATKSFGYRLEYWRATLSLIADHPWAGCGPGHFQTAYTRYKLPQASEEIADPHNFLLEVWATAGTPAMVALVVVIGLFLWRTCRAGRAVSGFAEAVKPGEHPWHVFAGAIGGFLLSIPLGLTGSASPGPIPVALGLPLALAAMLCFLPWVKHGTLPGLLPVVGVLAVLVNFSAAGGIGMSGVAGTFWLLLALGLAAVGPEAPHRVSRPAAFVGLAAGVALAIGCYVSAYAPVMKCQGWLRAFDRDPLRAEEHLRQAADADPLSAEPWKQLANLAFARWRQHPTAEAFRAFQQAAHEALARDPDAASTWLYFADCYAEAFERTGEKEALAQSVAMYRHAAELYPNSALYRARLAVAYQRAGRDADFRWEAALALELDARTPHGDQKLPEELRQSLLRSNSQTR